MRDDNEQIRLAVRAIEQTIDIHTAFHLYQIKLEAQQAMRQIRRKADFPARSAGQRRRYQRIQQGENK